MADAKKYYYMRLNEGYFNSDEQILLESMSDGYLYSNILLKLYLKSLRRDGLLMFSERIPYNAEMIATITRHNVGTVEKAMRIFQQLGIVEILDSGAIYMLDVQNYVGKTSTEADRIRAYRNKIETEKNAVKSLPDADCTNVHDDLYICTPEIEIKLKTEKELKAKEENDEKTKEKTEVYKNIIAYLNEKAGTRYKHTTGKTRDCIHARLKEGFTLDDFKTVIDKKCVDWLGAEKMERFIRPETLFGPKFEGYLNEKPRKAGNYNGANSKDDADNTNGRYGLVL